MYDFEHSIDEDRYIANGKVKEILFVVYTERKDSIRIISARLAGSEERSLYYDQKLPQRKFYSGKLTVYPPTQVSPHEPEISIDIQYFQMSVIKLQEIYSKKLDLYLYLVIKMLYNQDLVNHDLTFTRCCYVYRTRKRITIFRGYQET